MHTYLEFSRIRHLRRTLIPRQLWPRAQLHFLLLLDQGTASAPEGSAAVPTARAADTVPFAHLATSNCLNDPLGPAEGETGEDQTLRKH